MPGEVHATPAIARAGRSAAAMVGGTGECRLADGIPWASAEPTAEACSGILPRGATLLGNRLFDQAAPDRLS